MFQTDIEVAMTVCSSFKPSYLNDWLLSRTWEKMEMCICAVCSAGSLVVLFQGEFLSYLRKAFCRKLFLFFFFLGQRKGICVSVYLKQTSHSITTPSPNVPTSPKCCPMIVTQCAERRMSGLYCKVDRSIHKYCLCCSHTVSNVCAHT